MYEDLIIYKRGIYRHAYGDYLGRLPVKVLGWGIDDGIKYWKVANSWNNDWGEKGFIRISRSDSSLHLDEKLITAMPLF